jgi:hypothetical protein
MIRITKELNGNITRELAQSSDGTGLLVTNILPDGSRRDFKITEEALVSSSNIVEMLRLAAKNVGIDAVELQAALPRDIVPQVRQVRRSRDRSFFPATWRLISEDSRISDSLDYPDPVDYSAAWRIKAAGYDLPELAGRDETTKPRKSKKKQAMVEVEVSPEQARSSALEFDEPDFDKVTGK